MYYYEKAGQKKGPLSKEDLKGKISKNTLVWREGLENWIKASQLPELNDLFFNEPPPLPDAEPKTKAAIESVNNHALLLFVLLISTGFLEFFKMDDSKIYGVLITVTIIITYRVYSKIKSYLNKVLKYSKANTELIILIITSIIIGFSGKLASHPNFERKISDLPDDVMLFLAALIIVAIVADIYSLFSLGKKMSKIGNNVTSKISKFAYTTLISYALILVLLIFLENYTVLLLLSIISAMPLLYLIIGFNKSKEQIGYV